MRTTRILIIEGCHILREGVKALLKPAKDISIVAEVEAGEKVQGLLKDLPCNVILLGNNHRWLDELDAIRAIKTDYPLVYVILLFDDSQAGYYGSPLANFADCYVPVSIDPVSIDSVGLVKTIRRITKRVLPRQQKEKASNAHVLVSLQRPLSDREHQVVCLMAQGIRVGQIASLLGLSIKTITTFRHRAMIKLGYENNTQLTH